MTSGNTALSVLTDPQNKLVYEMHQYLDSDGSGTNANCVSGTIGQERLQAATQWLKQNGKKAILGEFAGGANAQCKQAVQGMLAYMQQNTDVWTGALWWAAGPWWADYIFSLEAPSGTAYTYYMDTLQQYAGNGQGGTPTTPTTPTSPATSIPAGNGNAVPKWGQCGGQGWTGGTVCVSGSTCTVSNQWYSQCT
jgi:endoglucanase